MKSCNHYLPSVLGKYASCRALLLPREIQCSQLSQSAPSCGRGRAGWIRENAAGIFLDVIIRGLDNAPNEPLSPSVIEFLQ